MDRTHSFGYWLRRRRKALDLTQAKLAQRVSCSLDLIQKIEADARRPSRQLAEKLAESLGLDASERVAFVQAARAERAVDQLPLPGQSLLRLVAGELPATLDPPTPLPRGRQPRRSTEEGEQAMDLGRGSDQTNALAPLVKQTHVFPRRHHALPVPLTPLIGRAREVAAVCQALEGPRVRLVTLIGPGGVGKTRVALQAAIDLRTAFADGVAFVDLAPIADATLVVAAIAQVLGVQEVNGQPLLGTLQRALGDKQLLLVLDNVEQVAAAATELAALLQAAPHLKVLMTSRIVVGVYGEHLIEVPPLSFPDPANRPPLEQLREYDAIRLFVERAQAMHSAFVLTQGNAAAVAAICRRLDGLPLAIELAAARVRLFSADALLARLEDGLAVLTSGASTLPARQRTLRATLDWSYRLLGSPAQTLFWRLGVFVGGCTPAAAEAVCTGGDLGQDILDGLATLVDTSLVQRVEASNGEPRFVMLETIRAYALELLEASGELEQLRRRHAAFFVELAEAGLLYERQALEFPNLRAALEWSRTEAEGTTGLRLVLALSWKHSVSEARLWLEHGLAQRAGGAVWQDSAASRSLRARALKMLGNIASWQDDLATAQPALEASLELFRELGDTWSIANVMGSLGRVLVWRGDYERSGALLEESLARFRQLGDSGEINMCFFYMGNLAYAQGNLRRASARWQESLDLARQREQQQVALSSGQHVYPWMVAISLLHLGIVALDRGDHGRAGAYLAETLTLFRDIGERWVILHTIEVCAALATARGAGRRAARLFGADEALRETLGLGILAIWRDRYQREVAAARVQLGEEAFAAAWAEGRVMTLEQAVGYALEGSAVAARQPAPAVATAKQSG